MRVRTYSYMYLRVHTIPPNSQNRCFKFEVFLKDTYTSRDTEAYMIRAETTIKYILDLIIDTVEKTKNNIADISCLCD